MCENLLNKYCSPFSKRNYKFFIPSNNNGLLKLLNENNYSNLYINLSNNIKEVNKIVKTSFKMSNNSFDNLITSYYKILNEKHPIISSDEHRKSQHSPLINSICLIDNIGKIIKNVNKQSLLYQHLYNLKKYKHNFDEFNIYYTNLGIYDKETISSLIKPFVEEKNYDFYSPLVPLEVVKELECKTNHTDYNINKKLGLCINIKSPILNRVSFGEIKNNNIQYNGERIIKRTYWFLNNYKNNKNKLNIHILLLSRINNCNWPNIHTHYDYNGYNFINNELGLSKIVMFSKEELDKNLLHHLYHSYNPTQQNKFGQKHIHNEKWYSDLNNFSRCSYENTFTGKFDAYEVIIDAFAQFTNILLYSIEIGFREKLNSRNIYRLFKYIWCCELNFVLFQTAKVLLSCGYKKYEDIYNNKINNILPLDIYAYYILRCIILLNIDNNSINNISSLNPDKLILDAKTTNLKRDAILINDYLLLIQTTNIDFKNYINISDDKIKYTLEMLKKKRENINDELIDTLRTTLFDFN